jgi:hypothetical protein
MAKREVVQRKSREEIIASLLADGIMSEADIAELAAQAAADEARAIMRKQRQPPAPPKPRTSPPQAPDPPVVPPLTPPPEPPAKDRYRIRNWKAYNQALKQRGSLTIWLEQDTIAAWKNQERNGLPGRDHTYAETAILTILTLKAVFHLPLRATEGLTASILQLARIELPIPDYSTLSRRRKTLEVPLVVERREVRHIVVDSSGLKVYGEGEWKVRKHGWSKRRTWRKIHIGVDETTQEGWRAW